MSKEAHKLFWILSPTYKLAERQKKKWLGTNNNKQMLSENIKKYNRYYLATTLWLAVYAGFFFKQEYYANEQDKYINLVTVILFCWFIIFSRGFEIFKAFIDDAVEKLNGKPSTSDLSYGDRLQLAFNSYIEIMVGFGVMYYMLPSSFFKSGAIVPFNFENIVEAIYFSGITMTTVGYGDISPANPITQILVVFQVFCGLTLALVSFTVYTSLALINAKAMLDRK